MNYFSYKMKNRNVGFLISGISIVLIVIVSLFNMALKDIVSTTCSHGNSCTMYSTISTQTWISLSIAFFILIIGLFLIFAKEETHERVIIKKIKEKTQKKKNRSLAGLDNDEKQVMELLNKERAIFQRELMERLEIGKVKTTRLLDKLEAKQFIERKRRGMNNVVVLKD